MIASPNTVQYIGNVLCYICIQSRLKLFADYLHSFLTKCLLQWI